MRSRRPDAETSIVCPLCSQALCDDRGEILHPRPTTVAGIEIELGDRPFHLLRCPACGFQFKHPAVDPGALIHCYRLAEGGHWEVQPDARERQFDRIIAALERHVPPRMDGAGGPRRVLDIGCFNGALLQELDGSWDKHGVEPSTEAARLAQSRGVAILGPTLDESAPADFFDAALAIDVIEHIPDPRPFFRLVARTLKPGGVFIVLTGDTEALSWRWLGSRYWYCSLVEHVSFYCRSALEHAAEQAGMRSIEQRRMSHIRAGAVQRASEAVKNIAYGMVVRVGWLPGQVRRERILHRRAPGWLTARDHLLHIMRRGRSPRSG